MPVASNSEENMPTFSTTNLPSDPTTWPKFRKTALASALRLEGPFRVETSEGPLTCADGYLAVDARGYPYPIASDEFELIYEPVAQGRTIVAGSKGGEVDGTR